MEQDFIENIRKIQNEFIDNYGLGKMDDQHKKIIKSIYEADGDFKSVSGKDAF